MPDAPHQKSKGDRYRVAARQSTEEEAHEPNNLENIFNPSVNKADFLLHIGQSVDREPVFSDAKIRSLLPDLQAYAKAKLRSSHEAEDLVQDAIERAWRARDRFLRGSDLKPWLISILRNVIIDHVRKARSAIRRSKLDCGIPSINLPDQLIALEYREFIEDLDHLKPEARKAILLVSAGLTHAEAAKELGCPLGTLKSYIRRGRDKHP